MPCARVVLAFRAVLNSGLMKHHLQTICLYTLSCFLLLFALSACDRPLKVDVSIAGAEKLPLAGKSKVKGTLSRTLLFGQNTFPKGTQVQISETWLLRQEKAQPPSYRISGHYNPESQRDGFVLPAGAVNIYYVGHPIEQRSQTVVIPAEHFQPLSK